MRDCLDVSEAAGRTLTSLQPLLGGAFAVSGSSQVVRQQFGLPFDQIGKILLKDTGDAGMQFLPARTQQRAVGGVLDQGVLESICRLRRYTATEQQPGIVELSKCRTEVRLRPLRHRLDQLIAEVAPDYRADLRSFPRCDANPVEPGDE
jgi:hypothetical protein